MTPKQEQFVKEYLVELINRVYGVYGSHEEFETLFSGMDGPDAARAVIHAMGEAGELVTREE